MEEEATFLHGEVWELAPSTSAHLCVQRYNWIISKRETACVLKTQQLLKFQKGQEGSHR